MHDLQTALRNAVELVLGVGGKDADGNFLQAAMQMLHGAYNLQNWHEKEELKKMYEFIRREEGLEEKFVPLPEPIVTRWWLVGACAVQFKESMTTWKRACKGVLTYSAASSAVGQIASCTLGLMQKATILCDNEILCVFHKWFIFKHFKYFQLGDNEIGGTPGFQNRHCLVRYFIMIVTLENACKDEEWKKMKQFQDLVSAIDKCEESKRDMQVKKYNIPSELS